VSSSWTISRATVAKKPSTRGRTRISRKTIAQGVPDRFGVPVVTCLRAFFTCTQGCGCVAHPAFPAPCFSRVCFPGLGHIVPREC
jgi:hypothetical protein